MNPAPYIGRFAPSPTGPLHFGSLVAAVASYLEARTNQGKWLVRLEDLDGPREIAGAADAILKTLEGFGFEWDGTVVYQSRRNDLYQSAFEALEAQHSLYPCGCTRKEIADSVLLHQALKGIDGLIYPGTCRHGLASGKTARAWRIKTQSENISFDDAIQGQITQNLAQEIGDFVLKRADGLFAYQLAVVVDDAAQRVTHILRGADLLDSTPRQIYLQRLLGTSQPHYAHIPVATNLQGEKLSKQTLALALNPSAASQQLWQALDFLGQQPPLELAKAKVSELWAWSHAHWELQSIPKVRSIYYRQ